MTEPEIRNAVHKILRQIAPGSNPDQVDPDENLREALDIDSFDFLNLMIALHEQLRVEIPESDYARLSTLGKLVGYLADREQRDH